MAIYRRPGFIVVALLWALASPVMAQTVFVGDDPWLSEEGPAVPAPVEVAREEVVAAWVKSSEVAFARAAVLQKVRLELGTGDLVAPARVILEGATEEDPEVYTAFALDLAPGVPLFRWAHVQALMATGDTGAAVKGVGATLWSVARNLAAQIWLIENFTLLLFIVILAAPLGFILLTALQVFPHAAHDLGDLLGGRRLPNFARSAALAALLLVPLALGEGIVGLALALFVVAFTYAKSHQRSVLVMAAILLVIGLHPLAQFVSGVTSLVEQDPVARSVMAVVSGVETSADVERLEAVSDTDPAAGHALAYRARRFGLQELARTRFEALRAKNPSDGFALAALGTIEMRRGNTMGAIDFYERAALQLPSGILLFDLSQAYAKVFRMDEYEATLVRAQYANADVVAELSNLADADLVADLPFPSHLLQERFQEMALSQDSQGNLTAELAPGRLGERWLVTAGSFSVAALFVLLLAGRFDHSSRCGRCGHRICTRCEETVWSEDLCEDCHHLFQSPDATDPSLRMARLQALAQRESKIDRIVLAASLLIPGVAGLAAQRPDFAMFGLFLFGWIVMWVAWPSGIMDDPLLMGDAAFLIFAVPGVISALCYAGVVFTSLVVRKSR